MANHIPNARFLEVPGVDHIFYVGDNATDIADAIEEAMAVFERPETLHVLLRFRIMPFLKRARKIVQRL